MEQKFPFVLRRLHAAALSRILSMSGFKHSQVRYRQCRCEHIVFLMLSNGMIVLKCWSKSCWHLATLRCNSWDFCWANVCGSQLFDSRIDSVHDCFELREPYSVPMSISYMPCHRSELHGPLTSAAACKSPTAIHSQREESEEVNFWLVSTFDGPRVKDTYTHKEDLAVNLTSDNA